MVINGEKIEILREKKKRINPNLSSSQEFKNKTNKQRSS